MMRCAVCGAELKASTTDLPFKVDDTTIVAELVRVGEMPAVPRDQEIA
jgi:hypothetical protein